MGKIISIINNKGGVGKTSSTGILAELLAFTGCRVLCVDLDQQSNLSIAYYFGKGVLKDKERGEQYLQAAIADGSEYAQNILDAGGLNVAYCLTKSVLSGLETMNRQQTYYNNQQSQSRQALREKQLHSDQNRYI